ncbi:hypothetical protein [Sphingomonas sp. LH128]|uniref:hypothetical protein n=1 Tax=Sphingomonas sp. LH128 TaxID=473781 RepID=UPI002E122F64
MPVASLIASTAASPGMAVAGGAARWGATARATKRAEASANCGQIVARPRP